MHNRLQRANSTTLALTEVERLDAERKARSMPGTASQSPSSAIEAQTEAVIDALLVATTNGDDRAYIHARHVGEWCARIATQLPGLNPVFMRRCGVLASVAANVLERVSETREYATVVSAHADRRHDAQSEDIKQCVGVVAVAQRFDALIFLEPEENRASPSEALRELRRSVDVGLQPIVGALAKAFRSAPSHIDTPAAA